MGLKLICIGVKDIKHAAWEEKGQGCRTYCQSNYNTKSADSSGAQAALQHTNEQEPVTDYSEDSLDLIMCRTALMTTPVVVTHPGNESSSASLYEALSV